MKLTKEEFSEVQKELHSKLAYYEKTPDWCKPPTTSQSVCFQKDLAKNLIEDHEKLLPPEGMSRSALLEISVQASRLAIQSRRDGSAAGDTRAKQFESIADWLATLAKDIKSV